MLNLKIFFSILTSVSIFVKTILYEKEHLHFDSSDHFGLHSIKGHFSYKKHVEKEIRGTFFCERYHGLFL